MLSIIVPTLDSERPLARTLAALVPGAIDGLISEAIVADAGSSDATAIVADAAGCTFIAVEGRPGRRMRMAVTKARAPFLLFMRPGIVVDANWVGEARRFVERSSAAPCAAVFRRGTSGRATLREVWALVADALGALPGPDQGLIIPREFYDALGGHAEHATDPEADLICRIGRRRLTTLGPSATKILD